MSWILTLLFAELQNLFYRRGIKMASIRRDTLLLKVRRPEMMLGIATVPKFQQPYELVDIVP